jgi:hypothetical protein
MIFYEEELGNLDSIKDYLANDKGSIEIVYFGNERIDTLISQKVFFVSEKSRQDCLDNNCCFRVRIFNTKGMILKKGLIYGYSLQEIMEYVENTYSKDDY